MYNDCHNLFTFLVEHQPGNELTRAVLESRIRSESGALGPFEQLSLYQNLWSNGEEVGGWPVLRIFG